MKMLKIKGIEKNFVIDSGKIYNINIENSQYFNRLINGLIDLDEDIFIFSENYELSNFSKNSLIIMDIFSLNPNSKKILTTLYNRIEKNYLSNEDKEHIYKINSDILNILEKISLELDVEVEYECDFDFIKILNSYQFRFKENGQTLLERLITFIKANLEIKSFDFIIAINLLSMINEKDLEIMQKELELLQITLININSISKINKNIVDYTTIDDDLCEF